jgi:hypothetical protein
MARIGRGGARRRSRDNPEERVRAILGVADDEPMPHVRLEPLRKFHDYLAVSFSFPFEGRLSSPIGPHRDTKTPLSVVRLMDPVKEYEPEEMYGLICKAVQDKERIDLPLRRIIVAKDNLNHSMLEDYCWWLGNWG